ARRVRRHSERPRRRRYVYLGRSWFLPLRTGRGISRIPIPGGTFHLAHANRGRGRRDFFMKLLWVKTGGLLPPDTGGKIRSYQILKQLARHHDITLFTYYSRHAGDEHLRGPGFFSRIVTVPLPLPAYRSVAEYANYGRLLFTGHAYSIEKYFAYPELRRTFEDLMRSTEFDGIICDFIFPAPLINWAS